MEPIKVLAVNGESDPAETGSFIEMRRRGVDITVITWPDTFNHEALLEARRCAGRRGADPALPC